MQYLPSFLSYHKWYRLCNHVENCDLCQEGKPNQCKNCYISYIKIDGKYQKKCLKGFFKDNNNICQKLKEE